LSRRRVAIRRDGEDFVIAFQPEDTNNWRLGRVQHDVRLEGRQSGVKRQIDVLVQEKIGQYEIKIIVDCEDHKTPVDVKGVEEFDGLLKDVGAQRGVLVCPSGFTDTVKRLTVEPHAP
jgi:hypothetical protein